ncbi:methyl-accepting chemotaxis protein [Pelagirhabdus alkalitolerans]|uniref:Methyl-accepting chemotaxis protein n=1 Tax=Pelagirhabdus alkalitolerans TaxID=1612202 RepID=A0A1G6GMT9_9BACI|nr:HAMP domain-containing methyl-accepting chemotaxis protein [Pelagirhabdus alkalitolerans]SDB83045.1 methyl-accepting chemotaxis protein [Pelagirhabdus alkalitolerans]
MKVKGKLITSYLSIVLLLVVVAVVAMMSLGNVNNYNELLYRNRVEPLALVAETIQLAENTRVHMLSGVTEEDSSRAGSAIENADHVDELIQTYQSGNLEPQEAELVETIERNWDIYSSSVRSNAQMLINDEFEDAAICIVDGGDAFRTFRSNLEELRNYNLAYAEQDYNESRQTYEMAQLIVIAIAIGAIIFAIALGIFMGQSTSRPLSDLSKRMKEIANGTLTGAALKTKRKDEFAELIGSTNQMQEDLRSVIESVSDASENVSSASEELTQSAEEVREGSEQIASTMQELSTGSETQATTVSGLSEKMDQFLRRIKASNDDAKSVSSESKTVIEKTDDGYQMMEQSIQQMTTIDSIVQDAVKKVEGLDKQSQQVSKLVDVIQDIAEQTNLLALNAAIEAARAGEHGKGFAVVADEVRKLAEDVSNSVREITTIINGIQTETNTVVNALENGYKEVNEGTTQLAKTGENFTSINDSINQMVAKIDKVTTNLTEITEESAQINESIEEIASISEESAAGVEQTAASSEESLSSMEEITSSAESLAELAENLSKEVSHFNVK